LGEVELDRALERVRAAATNPDSPDEIVLESALFLRRHGDPAGAARALAPRARAEASGARLLGEYGISLYLAGESKTARRWLDSALELRVQGLPEEPKLRAFQAIARGERREKIASLLLTAISETPDDPEIRKALGDVRPGLLPK
jgi:hypothetical protein